jgi:DNA-binding transcriptional LysR family regulator
VRLEQLEYLMAVTQFGSLRRAGEHLHVSQPALSEAVANLERELGVSLLDRRRTGARISAQGQDLLPAMVEVLEAVGRLRTAAGDQGVVSRTVRVGTVNAGTSTLVVPAVHAFRESFPHTVVEMVNTQQGEIHQGLVEGTLDLGLDNALSGDDVPPDLHATVLLHGRAVVCCRRDSPLAEKEVLTVHDLRRHPVVTMRSGYLMHRLVHRLFDGALPPVSASTDGAEMGKLLVAEGLGFTILPDYSVAGDPLTRAGTIVLRPLAEDRTSVTLLCLRRRAGHVPPTVRRLHADLVAQARLQGTRGVVSDPEPSSISRTP